VSSKAKKVVLFSKSDYAEENDVLLYRLIDEKILLGSRVAKHLT
jgi:hypothetical protein